MKKKIFIIIGILLVIGVGIGSYIYLDSKTDNINKKNKNIDEYNYDANTFSLKFIKYVNSKIDNENYLVSPYSVEVALNLVKEGANNNTLLEIENVIGDRNIPDISSENVKIANAIFIKSTLEYKVRSDYVNKLKELYNADVILDEFKTPDKINEWVNNKTDGMIKKILDSVSDEFLFGLANAVSIDVEWINKFECYSTKEEEFTKNDNSKINVEMMHNTYKGNTSYFETDNGKGVIIPYRSDNEGKQLEFVAILPNNSVNEYINNLTEEELSNIDNDKIEASNKINIQLSLPRFTYDYDLNSFKDILQDMGIRDAFTDGADFSNAVSDESVYISNAIHKTHIELNEEGTKAAAITYFGFDASAHEEEPKIYKIEFNKTFIYMIRDKETKEILFFGVVDEPNTWEGSTCEE